MPDERNARPVSGEIMAAPLAGAEPAEPGLIHADVVDAEYETVRLGESAVQARTFTSIGTATAPLQGLGSLRKADTAARPQGPVRGGPVFWIFGLGLAAGAFWVSGGHALVRQAPFAATSPKPGGTPGMSRRGWPSPPPPTHDSLVAVGVTSAPSGCGSNAKSVGGRSAQNAT